MSTANARGGSATRPPTNETAPPPPPAGPEQVAASVETDATSAANAHKTDAPKELFFTIRGARYWPIVNYQYRKTFPRNIVALPLELGGDPLYDTSVLTEEEVSIVYDALKRVCEVKKVAVPELIRRDGEVFRCAVDSMEEIRSRKRYTPEQHNEEFQKLLALMNHSSTLSDQVNFHLDRNLVELEQFALALKHKEHLELKNGWAEQPKIPAYRDNFNIYNHSFLPHDTEDVASFAAGLSIFISSFADVCRFKQQQLTLDVYATYVSSLTRYTSVENSERFLKQQEAVVRILGFNYHNASPLAQYNKFMERLADFPADLKFETVYAAIENGGTLAKPAEMHKCASIIDVYFPTVLAVLEKKLPRALCRGGIPAACHNRDIDPLDCFLFNVTGQCPAVIGSNHPCGKKHCITIDGFRFYVEPKLGNPLILERMRRSFDSNTTDDEVKEHLESLNNAIGGTLFLQVTQKQAAANVTTNKLVKDTIKKNGDTRGITPAIMSLQFVETTGRGRLDAYEVAKNMGRPQQQTGAKRPNPYQKH